MKKAFTLSLPFSLLALNAAAGPLLPLEPAAAGLAAPGAAAGAALAAGAPEALPEPPSGLEALKLPALEAPSSIAAPLGGIEQPVGEESDSGVQEEEEGSSGGPAAQSDEKAAARGLVLFDRSAPSPAGVEGLPELRAEAAGPTILHASPEARTASEPLAPISEKNLERVRKIASSLVPGQLSSSQAYFIERFAGQHASDPAMARVLQLWLLDQILDVGRHSHLPPPENYAQRWKEGEKRIAGIAARPENAGWSGLLRSLLGKAPLIVTPESFRSSGLKAQDYLDDKIAATMTSEELVMERFAGWGERILKRIEAKAEPDLWPALRAAVEQDTKGREFDGQAASALGATFRFPAEQTLPLYKSLLKGPYRGAALWAMKASIAEKTGSSWAYVDNELSGRLPQGHPFTDPQLVEALLKLALKHDKGVWFVRSPHQYALAILPALPSRHAALRAQSYLLAHHKDAASPLRFDDYARLFQIAVLNAERSDRGFFIRLERRLEPLSRRYPNLFPYDCPYAKIQFIREQIAAAVLRLESSGKK